MGFTVGPGGGLNFGGNPERDFLIQREKLENEGWEKIGPVNGIQLSVLQNYVDVSENGGILFAFVEGSPRRLPPSANLAATSSYTSPYIYVPKEPLSVGLNRYIPGQLIPVFGYE